MAIKREEEKLGAFQLVRHFVRIVGYVREKRWLLVVCAALSLVQAGLELSLPLITRHAIDDHILPPYVRVTVRDPEIRSLMAGVGGRMEAGGDPDHLFVRASALGQGAKAQLQAKRAADKERYYYIPTPAAGGASAAGGAGAGSFVSESSLASAPAAERRVLLGPERRNLIALGWIYLALLVLNFALSYSVSMGLNDLGQRAVQSIRAQLFAHLHRLPIRYFDENPVGRLVTRMTNDTATLSELFTSVVATAVSDLILFFGILGILLSMDVGLTVRLFLLAPPLVILALWFKAASARVYREIRVKLARVNTYLQESVQGITVLKAFLAEARTSLRFRDLGRDYYLTQMRLIYIFAVFRPLIDAFATSAVAVVVWYGGGQALRAQVSIGTLVAFLIYLKMLFMPLQDLAEKFNIVQSSVVASERLFKILDEPPEPPGKGLEPRSPCGSVRFENVRFAYDEEVPVLRDVSFEVPCGKTVALVGPTGSGKTTITSLLLRFYDLAEGGGRILVDGLPVEDWDVRDLRGQFALVQQDLFLFAGSLGRNIGLLRDVPPGDMARALEASRANMVLDKLPDRLDHLLNERGTVLSQGERQLISFARALAANPRILVLDEATASVDSATEAAIQQAMKNLLTGRTALVVAHRLSTVQDAHQILVLKKGRIAEQGTHAELLAKDGLYAHLYRTQFGAGG